MTRRKRAAAGATGADAAAPGWRRLALRVLALLALALLALQLGFVARVALLRIANPGSTAFERSEAVRLLGVKGPAALGDWQQQWRNWPALGEPIKRAVIASEDAEFTDHNGVEWDAIESAWAANQRAEAAAAATNARLAARAASQGRPVAPRKLRQPRVVGGSTITQQLAKNLFLSGERSLARKAQEMVIALAIEALLDKPRILELYLNHVEWGEGVFGAEAAARHYFRTDVDRLGDGAAARLAVMLPAPKRFEKRPDSPYVRGRAARVLHDMPAVEMPE